MHEVFGHSKAATHESFQVKVSFLQLSTSKISS